MKETADYEFERIEQEARDYEDVTRKRLVRLSDWNTSLNEVSAPLELYVESLGRSLSTLTNYPETIVTQDICARINLELHKQGIAIDDLHLFGSATQAINMLFFALNQLVKKAEEKGDAHFSVRRSPEHDDLILVRGRRVIFVQPGYFSVKDSAAATNFDVIDLYRTAPNFEIDFQEIDLIVSRYLSSDNRVMGIIITEPIYSAGVSTHTQQLRRLVEYARANNLLLIVDGAFSGLHWRTNPSWQDGALLRLLSDGIVLVDSISKKLFFLNTKIGVLYGPSGIVESARDGADWLSGNITGLQQQLAKAVYGPEHREYLSVLSRTNIALFSERFEELERLAKESQYMPIRPDSGYHALLILKDGTPQRNVDPFLWSQRLFKKGVFPISTHDFGYPDDGVFGFRIALSRVFENRHIEAALNQSIFE
jgi:aspartate/methionine/tyrosine aminotransferase